MTTQAMERNNIRAEKSPVRKNPGINIGWNERKISVLAGSGLIAVGLSRKSWGGLVLAAAGALTIHRGLTGQCGLYEKLGINTAKNQPSPEPKEYFEHGVHVAASFTINKPAAELFNFWRDFTNLPKFMDHLKSVEMLEGNRSRWTAKAPIGWSVSWDAEIINEEPGKLIAWRSVGGADVDNAGSVRFIPAPHDRGTEVHVVLDYIPPAGKVGAIIAKIFREDPSIQITEDLRRFKAIMETGEYPTTIGQPRGNCSGGGKLQTSW